jgi:hypothetical protein
MYKPAGKSNYELYVKGHITCKSLTIDSGADISGLDYDKLINKPSAKDFGIDENKTITYSEDVIINSETDSKTGITTKTI